MTDPSPFRNEIHAVTAAPWSHAHPRSDHQLVFPLSGDRLLLVWCAYYVRRPSAIGRTPFEEGASLRDDAPCQISARVSSDRGRTWSDVMTLQENHGASNVKHPNLLRLPTGRILFSYTERDAAAQRLRVRLRVSDDECETFGPSRDITPGPGWYFTNADHILRHSSGRIILPCHAGPIYGKGDHWQAFCLYSDDDGETWRESRVKMDLPKRGAEEPAVIERRDGSLLALLRTSLGTLYRGWSTDAGETWSEPVATELDSPSVATCMKRMPGGDLLLIWNDTPPYGVSIPGSGLTHQPRNPLRSAISQDDGETWRNRRTIEDRFGYDNAYPSVTFVGDEALIGYYSTVKSGVRGMLGEARLKIYPIDWFSQPDPVPAR